MRFNIPGVNAKKGLELYDDDEDIFILVLRSFAKNVPTSLDKLRNVTAETLPSYMIGIHGLKGTSANIGAEDLREKAKNLEVMAKSGDLAGVQAKNDAFLKEADTLIADISAWLKQNAPE